MPTAPGLLLLVRSGHLRWAGRGAPHSREGSGEHRSCRVLRECRTRVRQVSSLVSLVRRFAALAATTTKVRLRKTLIDERTAWLQRIQAQLFHHGVPKSVGLLAPARREQLTALALPDSARTLSPQRWS